MGEYPKAELEAIDQVAKERNALELRLGHWSYQDIADIQGVSVPTVRARIKRAVQAGIPKETRDQARAMETTRIDRMQRFNELVIQSGGTTIAEKMAAQAMWYRGLEARAKLLGLYLPVELEVKYSGALDHEIEALMVQFHAQSEIIDGEVAAEEEYSAE